DRIWPSMALVYGPLAVAALLLIWSWYAALITLAGAALASHVKTMLLEGHGPAETERRHAGEAHRPDASPGDRTVPACRSSEIHERTT
nr:hypothetical protein [Propionibacteriaceae bacterium]